MHHIHLVKKLISVMMMMLRVAKKETYSMNQRSQHWYLNLSNNSHTAHTGDRYGDATPSRIS